MSKFVVNEHVIIAVDFDSVGPLVEGGKPVRRPKRSDKGVVVAEADQMEGETEPRYYVRITPWLDPFIVKESSLLSQAEYQQQEAEQPLKGSDPRNGTWPDEYRIDPWSGRPYIPETGERDD